MKRKKESERGIPRCPITRPLVFLFGDGRAPAEVQPAAAEAAKAEAPEGGGGTKRGAEELAGEGDDADDGKRSKAEA